MSDERPRLILASNSPRRQELLRQAGYRFAVRPPPVGETAVRPGGAPGPYAESLAYLKAQAAIETHGLTDGLVLGADTVVDLAGRLLGKPADAADARRILGLLAGTEHRVVTGLALVDVARGRRVLAHEVTRVRMRPMTEAEIGAYVASGEALGKAGAYAIQETGDRYVDVVQGSLTNVVGLPMRLLERMMKAAGHDPRAFRDA